jgi:anti-sigma28 factor (negative regulator of flagellin synthesis)
MEILSTTSVGGGGAVAGKPFAGNVRPQGPSDRVSTLDIDRAADMARGVQGKVGELRLVRLEHIGEAICKGNYQPSASQVASRLLDAAEIDEHLQALLTAR